MWNQYYWIAIGLATVAAIILCILFSPRKRPLVQSKNELEGTVTYQTYFDKEGEEQILFIKKKSTAELLIVIYVYLEFIKDFLIIVLYEPMTKFQALDMKAFYVIFIGFPCLLFLALSVVFAYFLFYDRGIQVVLTKIQGIPLDEYGKVLSEKEVSEMRENDKGHEVIIERLIIDRQGFLRLSTRNFFKFVNDKMDYAHLNIRLADLPNVLVTVDEKPEISKLINTKSLTRRKLVDVEDGFIWEMEAYKYESALVLQELMKACETRKIAITNFLSAHSFVNVFQKLNNDYIDLNNKYQQLVKYKDILILQGVAKKLAEFAILEGISTEVVEYEELEDVVDSEENMSAVIQEMAAEIEKELFQITDSENEENAFNEPT